MLIDEELFQAERQARASIARQKRIDLALNQQAFDAEQGREGYNNKNNDSRDNNKKSKNSKGKKDNNSLHYAELLPERFYTDLVSNLFLL